MLLQRSRRELISLTACSMCARLGPNPLYSSQAIESLLSLGIVTLAENLFDKAQAPQVLLVEIDAQLLEHVTDNSGLKALND